MLIRRWRVELNERNEERKGGEACQPDQGHVQAKVTGWSGNVVNAVVQSDPPVESEE